MLRPQKGSCVCGNDACRRAQASLFRQDLFATLAAPLASNIHSKTARLLSANPFIGRIGEIKGTRELVISGTPYIVAYRVRDTQIEVLFVQHGARDWPDDV
jgi:plasmid stabilization system protein ParE